jgi:hypothetical protein
MLRHAERFDTALMPLHVADTCFSDSPKMSFEQTALPAAVERGVGIFGIKVLGNAFLLRTFSVGDCLRYTLSLPITATPLGACTIGQTRRRRADRAELQADYSAKRRRRCSRALQAAPGIPFAARRLSTGRCAEASHDQT